MNRRDFLYLTPGALLGAQRSAAEHPRLYLTAERVAQLRSAITTTHAEIWGVVKQQADSVAGSRPPVFEKAKDSSGDEQLWQREVGNKLPYVAMAYLLTGEKKYLDAAKEWSLASCGYPHWGLGSSRDGKDLAAGHQLFGLALVYDWLYSDLDAGTRETIRRTLIERGAVMFTAASRRTSFLQNHLWVDACGLAAAGYALAGDPEAGKQASEWIAMAMEKFRRTEAALGPDGASHEGVGYWGYGVEYMLKFWALAGADLNVSMVEQDGVLPALHGSSAQLLDAEQQYRRHRGLPTLQLVRSGLPARQAGGALPRRARAMARQGT